MSPKQLQNIMETKTHTFIDAVVNEAAAKNADTEMQNRIREELQAQLLNSELKQHFSAGFSLMMDDLKNYLPAVTWKQVQEECTNALNTLAMLSEQQFDSAITLAKELENIPDTLQELLGFSEETFEHGYQSGLRQYMADHYQAASDIFFTLSILCPLKSNVWLAYGLAEKQLIHYAKALEAFAMAAIVDNTSAIPFIYTAECYLAMHEPQLAKVTLQHAVTLIQSHPTQENKQYENYIRELQTNN